MKNILLTLTLITLLLFSTCKICTLAYEKVYLQRGIPLNYGINRYNNSYYNPYISPYRYRALNANDARRLRRMRVIRNMQRMQRNYYRNNFLTWNNSKTPKNGVLTGYSVPVNSDDDIYYDYNSGKKVKNHNKNTVLKPSSNCSTELYSMPAQDNSYQSSNGQRINDTGGVAGKTGVTIIWD